MAAVGSGLVSTRTVRLNVGARMGMCGMAHSVLVRDGFSTSADIFSTFSVHIVNLVFLEGSAWLQVKIG